MSLHYTVTTWVPTTISMGTMPPPNCVFIQFTILFCGVPTLHGIPLLHCYWWPPTLLPIGIYSRFRFAVCRLLGVAIAISHCALFWHSTIRLFIVRWSHSDDTLTEAYIHSVLPLPTCWSPPVPFRWSTPIHHHYNSDHVTRVRLCLFYLVTRSPFCSFVRYHRFVSPIFCLFCRCSTWCSGPFSYRFRRFTFLILYVHSLFYLRYHRQTYYHLYCCCVAPFYTATCPPRSVTYLISVLHERYDTRVTAEFSLPLHRWHSSFPFTVSTVGSDVLFFFFLWKSRPVTLMMSGRSILMLFVDPDYCVLIVDMKPAFTTIPLAMPVSYSVVCFSSQMMIRWFLLLTIALFVTAFAAYLQIHYIRRCLPPCLRFAGIQLFLTGTLPITCCIHCSPDITPFVTVVLFDFTFISDSLPLLTDHSGTFYVRYLLLLFYRYYIPFPTFTVPLISFHTVAIPLYPTRTPPAFVAFLRIAAFSLHYYHSCSNFVHSCLFTTYRYRCSVRLVPFHLHSHSNIPSPPGSLHSGYHSEGTFIAIHFDLYGRIQFNLTIPIRSILPHTFCLFILCPIPFISIPTFIPTYNYNFPFLQFVTILFDPQVFPVIRILPLCILGIHDYHHVVDTARWPLFYLQYDIIPSVKFLLLIPIHSFSRFTGGLPVEPFPAHRFCCGYCHLPRCYTWSTGAVYTTFTTWNSLPHTTPTTPPLTFYYYLPFWSLCSSPRSRVGLRCVWAFTVVHSDRYVDLLTYITCTVTLFTLCLPILFTLTFCIRFLPRYGADNYNYIDFIRSPAPILLMLDILLPVGVVLIHSTLRLTLRYNLPIYHAIYLLRWPYSWRYRFYVPYWLPNFTNRYRCYVVTWHSLLPHLPFRLPVLPISVRSVITTGPTTTPPPSALPPLEAAIPRAVPCCSTLPPHTVTYGTWYTDFYTPFITIFIIPSALPATTLLLGYHSTCYRFYDFSCSFWCSSVVGRFFTTYIFSPLFDTTTTDMHGPAFYHLLGDYHTSPPRLTHRSSHLPVYCYTIPLGILICYSVFHTRFYNLPDFLVSVFVVHEFTYRLHLIFSNFTMRFHSTYILRYCRVFYLPVLITHTVWWYFGDSRLGHSFTQSTYLFLPFTPLDRSWALLFILPVFSTDATYIPFHSLFPVIYSFIF